VIATATGARATRFVRALGANVVIDARAEDLVQRLRRAAPEGLDAVLAFGGGEELERCLDFVRSGGRLVHPNGIEPEPVPRKTLRTKTYDVVAEPKAFAKLNRALAKPGVRVPVAATYPLGKADEAHRRLKGDHVVGRMVLRIGGRA
jgi:NADPH:quinone reductase